MFVIQLTMLTLNPTIMKKLFFVLGLALVVSLGFSSCKKCSTCKVYNSSTNALEYTYPEQCGKTSVINTYEAAAKAAYSGSGYRVECTN